MSRSQKFPVAVHVMTTLALYPEECLNSERIASSVGTNAVVVRRILQALKARGLVACQGGVYGGARLTDIGREATLLDIQEAVDEDACFCKVHDGNQACWISDGVRQVVPGILEQAEHARRESLRRHRLVDVSRQVAQQRPVRKQAS